LFCIVPVDRRHRMWRQRGLTAVCLTRPFSQFQSRWPPVPKGWPWRHAHPKLRSHVFGLLKDGPTSLGLTLLAQAFAESPDTEGLLLLIRFETEQKRPLVGRHTIEEVITERVPSEDWKGAYDVVPVPVVELRKRLLGMTTTGGADDTAARCLNFIDKIRDQYGAPESEPRHPDLASGRPWPIITPDPDEATHMLRELKKRSR
jgi:hypothetical protein